MSKDFTSRLNTQQSAIQTNADSNKQASNDADVIRKAYEDLIEVIFKNFYQEAFVSKPPPNQLQQAETNFRNGVAKARQARDRAIALLPP
jgi:hypothetical protein